MAERAAAHLSAGKGPPHTRDALPLAAATQSEALTHTVAPATNAGAGFTLSRADPATVPARPAPGPAAAPAVAMAAHYLAGAAEPRARGARATLAEGWRMPCFKWFYEFQMVLW